MPMQLDVKALQPLPGYILVEPARSEDKTAGGIFLPENSEEKPQMGTVLSVGGDWVNEHGVSAKSPVKAKDKVLYKKWGGHEVKIGDVEYQFLKFEDVLAIVK